MFEPTVIRLLERWEFSDYMSQRSVPCVPDCYTLRLIINPFDDAGVPWLVFEGTSIGASITCWYVLQHANLENPNPPVRILQGGECLEQVGQQLKEDAAKLLKYRPPVRFYRRRRSTAS